MFPGRDASDLSVVRLPLLAPFEVGPAMAMLAACAIPGCERVDLASASHTRLFFAGGSEPVAVTVTLRPDHVVASFPTGTMSRAAAIIEWVRRWLDLDADPTCLLGALGWDPVIGPLVRARPGLRVISYPDGFEAAVMSVLGQQVSLAAAGAFGGRAVSAYGSPGPEGLRKFPEPEVLAAATPAELQAAIGVTHARSRTLHAVATACANGLVIDPSGDLDETRRLLMALPGIGPWTVDYLSVRALGDRDAFPAGDLVLQRALGLHTSAAARRASEHWSPYRAYALFHLWSAALGI